MGTIASFARHRPDLEPVLLELQNFECCGEFMLTEVGHGLDARNIETTATRNPDGSFDLHTPGWEASKIMPPTTVYARVPRVAVVFARLVVDGERRSMRPFVVRIADRDRMAPGITARMLPPRAGAKVLDHAITNFHHVHLPESSLLGDVEEAANPYQDFLNQIHRVTVGTLALSLTNVCGLRLSSYILGRYSQRRLVADGNSTRRIPIINFSTQHIPVLTALTLADVLEAFAGETCKYFRLLSDDKLRAGLACIFKQTATNFSASMTNELIERCGWQGLYSHNQIIELGLATRGNAIAEGDILVLCIRLGSELLTGRFAMPKPQDATCLLAQHEVGVWQEASEILARLKAEGKGHRSEQFNSLILPRSRMLVQAIGERMAYEAASASDKVSADQLELYKATCILRDLSWYVEHLGLSRKQLHKRHAEAVQRLLPQLDEILEGTEAGSL
ncbi:hypothetical protein CDD83_3438 [Cordyceps sp. RAO-2017]|nr:hypothetical protein CDD83_3438 [Cordyceps sp. RAO-2017]